MSDDAASGSCAMSQAACYVCLTVTAYAPFYHEACKRRSIMRRGKTMLMNWQVSQRKKRGEYVQSLGRLTAPAG